MEIKLEKRIKYAGDVYIELIKCGFTPEGATELLNHAPDVKDGSNAPAVNKAKIQQTLDDAINNVKVYGTHGQRNFAEGMIKMARLAGAVTEGDYQDLMDHLDSLKGYCDYQNDLRNVANPVSWEEVNGVEDT